jgi:Transposase DDE domain
MLNMIKGSLQIELDKFFELQSKSGLPCREVTSAAFCLARKKYSHSAFVEINNVLTKTVYQSSNLKTWRGHRLLAVDGSTLTLPKTLQNLDDFGKANHHANYPTLRLSQLYDVLNRQTVDFQHSSFSTGERDLAIEHLRKTTDNDLVLYDRGYGASWLFALHNKHKNDFCARLKSTFSSQVKAFSDGKCKDKIIKITHAQVSRKRCKELGLKLDDIKVRLLKVCLPSGEVEILATSLIDKNAYPASVFKKLYHQRWFIEEDYKIMKSRMEFENFTGKSSESVLQDIYAKVVTKNFAAILLLESQDVTDINKKRKSTPVQINFTYILNKLKDIMVKLLLGYQSSQILLRALIEQCAKQTHKIRPNRSEPRDMTKMNKLKYFMSYKRTT